MFVDKECRRIVVLFSSVSVKNWVIGLSVWLERLFQGVCKYIDLISYVPYLPVNEGLLVSIAHRCTCKMFYKWSDDHNLYRKE